MAMCCQKLLIFFGILCVDTATCSGKDMAICHDDFNLDPPDGELREHSLFPWLGFVEYNHETVGVHHRSQAPRVVLIHKQFAIGTTTDMLQLPKNFKLGNVIFGDYDREEEDCGLTKTQINMGVTCARAYIEIPIEDILPHPEYSKFGVKNSLALVKLIRPMKSSYMIPICLPTIGDREKKRATKIVFMIDYRSVVPKDFDVEKMAKKTLKLYTHKECQRHRLRSNLANKGITHILCSSGCGVRPGAPIISHTFSGTFELVGVAAGGAPCDRHGMRKRLNADPPLYIDVFPYVAWIVNMISAHVMPLPYSQQLKLVDAEPSSTLSRVSHLRQRTKQKHGWKRRMYVSGNWCYKSGQKQRTAAVVYLEKFEVNGNPPTRLKINLKVSTGVECKIVCARLLLPNRLTTPVISGVGGFNISVEFSTDWFPYSFSFSLGLTGKNASASERREWINQVGETYW